MKLGERGLIFNQVRNLLEKLEHSTFINFYLVSY